MKNQSITFLGLLSFLVVITGCSPQPASESYNALADSLRFSGEVHLRNIKQLTFGGNNAEAYWSFDNNKLVFQSDWDYINGQGCDQIFVMDVNNTTGSSDDYVLASTGLGRTTCSYFTADGRVIYGSTHAANRECPALPEGRRYVWPIYDTFDIYISDADGSNAEVLIGGDGYDAEATVSPDGKYIVFTSTRSGDLELWRYEFETGEIMQLTDELGYDGGAFFSPDSKKLIWRASRPEGEQAERYQQLLAEGQVEPSSLELFVADLDGSNKKQITNLGAANWAPFFHPSGEKIIFSTNHHTIDTNPREFDLFMVDLDGSNLTQITHSGTFDAFPMFSFDGKKIAFSSNRRVDRADSRDTNVFVADWIEEPTEADRQF